MDGDYYEHYMLYSNFAVKGVQINQLIRTYYLIALTLVFLSISYLPSGFHQVFLKYVLTGETNAVGQEPSNTSRGTLPVFTNSKHPSFCDYISQVGAVETVG